MRSFKGYGKVEALDQERLEAKRKTKRRIIIISIASLVLVAIITSVAIVVVRSKRGNNDGSTELKSTSKAMEAVCKTTPYPDLCISSLSSYPGASKAGPKDLFNIAVVVALDQVQKGFDVLSNLTEQADDPKQRAALDICGELMDESRDQLNSSSVDLKNFDLKSLMEPYGDVGTWLSAALTNLDTCVDGLSSTSSNAVKHQMESTVQNLRELVSNSLAIVKSIAKVLNKFNIKFPTRRLLSDEFHDSMDDGYPAWLSAADRRLLQADVTPNVVVAADGSGNYKTIKEAVDAAPTKSKTRFIIKVKKGIYLENVEVSKKKTMIMFTGEGMENTIVSGSKNFVEGTPTFRTATFAAVGMDFIAVDMQFTNTAGAANHQAVALRVGSDKSLFLRCKITGYQDTLYAHSLRQFYKDCWISGTVDFIFGNAAVVFQNCTIAARVPDADQKNTITAQGRTDPNQNTGISIHDCTITGESDLIKVNNTILTYLGRPWKEYSRTVIMLSEMGGLIDPAGWLEWNGDFALQTLYYAEYNNVGAGAGVANRVKWPGYKVITSEDEAKKFTVGEFVGVSWLESAGVSLTYTGGLTS